MNTLFGVHHEEKALSSWDIEEPNRPTHWRHLYRASFAPLQNQRILLTILKIKRRKLSDCALAPADMNLFCLYMALVPYSHVANHLNISHS